MAAVAQREEDRIARLSFGHRAFPVRIIYARRDAKLGWLGGGVRPCDSKPQSRAAANRQLPAKAHVAGHHYSFDILPRAAQTESRFPLTVRSRGPPDSQGR